MLLSNINQTHSKEQVQHDNNILKRMLVDQTSHPAFNARVTGAIVPDIADISKIIFDELLEIPVPIAFA